MMVTINIVREVTKMWINNSYLYDYLIKPLLACAFVFHCFLKERVVFTPGVRDQLQH